MNKNMLKYNFYKIIKVVLWGVFNKFIVYVILCRVLFFDIKNLKLLILNIFFCILENMYKKQYNGVLCVYNNY